MFAAGEFLVARVHDRLLATATVVKHRLVDVAAGNADLFAVFHIGNGAPADRLFDSLLDVITVAPQKPLAVHRALVLAIETSVDHIAHDCSLEAVLKGASGYAASDRCQGMFTLPQALLDAACTSLPTFEHLPEVCVTENAYTGLWLTTTGLTGSGLL
ncbi:hypothetical protein D3C80_1418130 [compost metagenome]